MWSYFHRKKGKKRDFRGSKSALGQKQALPFGGRVFRHGKRQDPGVSRKSSPREGGKELIKEIRDVFLR